MAVIDFTKIKAKETPNKMEKVNVMGTVFEVRIYPLTGRARMEYWALDHQDEADERARKRIMLALVNGAKMDEVEAFKFIELDWSAALELAGSIYKFTLDFEMEVEEFKKVAEKNLPKASGTGTQA